MSKLNGRRLTTALLLLALAGFAAGCGGGNSAGGPTLSATPERRPELDLETVKRAVNGSWVEDVPAADGKGKPQDWRFFYNEPKEMEIVEQKVEGDAATVVVNMKTRSAPRSPVQMSLEGQLRLHMRLETEVFIREWDVVEVENISFKYTMQQPPLPPPGGPSPEDGASPPAIPPAIPTEKPGASPPSRNSKG
jgi:hypothetical protein